MIILTDYFSTLVKSILNQILNNIRNSAIILIIISIIKITIDNLIKKKKEIKIIKIEEWSKREKENSLFLYKNLHKKIIKI